MDYLWGLFILAIGAIVGSFLNVVALRYGTGKSPLTGRSFCSACNRKLSAVDLVPVFSFIFLGGKCRTCKAKISWQYPLVEILTAIIFLFLFKSPLALVAWCILIVIMIYDWRHKIIPDGLALAFGILTLVMAILANFDGNLFLALLWGPLFATPFFLLWYFSGGKWMGLGDAKLGLGLGWLLGVKSFDAFIWAFWIGAAVSLLIVFWQSWQKNQKKLTMKSEVPFAPFLFVATFLVYFFNISALGLINNLFY
ncbi:MAG: prepilin peptidase [Candidatus Paceibacterota bacterium]|jgi:prepilin signal peptidase PulO-like enzyme (type II secretory pathway)